MNSRVIFCDKLGSFFHFPTPDLSSPSERSTTTINLLPAVRPDVTAEGPFDKLTALSNVEGLKQG
jgi:hypothetical protein